jgi:hypothetical protein
MLREQLFEADRLSALVAGLILTLATHSAMRIFIID